MKHQHTHAADGDVDINLNLPTEDLEDLIDKVTDAAVVIIVTYTAGHILRSLVKRDV